MIPVERQRAILTALGDRGSVSIADLVDQLGVSHMTVRRDIAALEEAGRVASVSGGVTLPSRLTLDQPHATKTQLRPGEKQAIAQAAAEMVKPNGLIFLDAGTTTLAIADQLAGRSDLTFLTNDLAVATTLAERSPARLYLASGQVDQANLSCEGEITAATIRQFNIDVAFLSTPAFDLRGTSVPSEAKKVVKRAVVECANQTVLVADSSKYGRVMELRGVGLTELDAVICDDGLPQAARDSIAEQGVPLRIVRAAG